VFERVFTSVSFINVAQGRPEKTSFEIEREITPKLAQIPTRGQLPCSQGGGGPAAAAAATSRCTSAATIR
jgi:hypothetical protein